jgi:hypothetical protein
VPMTAIATSEDRVASSASSGPIIPPLYTGADGGFSLLLSPGSPCTAACLRLQGTF